MPSRRIVLSMLVSCVFVTVADAEPVKKNHHKNGHNLLGEKLKENGRHQIDKAGDAAVSAEVNNGKVTAMSANHPVKGNLPVQKVRTRQKLADMGPQRIYGWCFDDGLDEYCYWYHAELVILDGSWVEYAA